jgi:nardilysin
LLTCAWITPDWNPNKITEALSLMTPLQMRIDILSPIFSSGKAVEGDDQTREAHESDEGMENSSGEDDDDSQGSEESEDDDGDEDDGESNDDVSVEVQLSDAELADLYRGPSEWCQLIHPPTHAPLLEPYFSTTFWVDDIPGSLLAYWTNSQSSSATLNEQDDHYHRFPTCSLPPRNMFIPEQLSVLNPDASSLIPEPIMRSESFCIWHLCDIRRYPIPKCELTIRVVSSIPSADAVNHPLSYSGDDVLAWIFHDLSIHVLREVMNETIYVASLAELYCDIFDSRNAGVGIKVSGFNDKAADLLVKVLETFLSLPYTYLSTSETAITEPAFQRLVENLTRIYANANTKTANTAINDRSAVLAPSIPSSQQRSLYIQEHANKLTKSSLKANMEEHFRAVYVEGLFQGNISREYATSLSHRLQQIKISSGADLLLTRLSAASYPELHVLKLPAFGSQSKRKKLAPMLVRNIPSSKQEKNICVNVHYQIGAYEPQMSLILHYFDQIITEPFFDDLRTKQQVRYASNSASLS